MTGGKLELHSERRLLGDEFWCGSNMRHFRVSSSIPSPGDFLPGDDSSGAAEDGWETGCSGGNQRQGAMTEELAATQESKAPAEAGEVGGTEPLSGVDICFNGVREKGQVDNFVVVSDRGMVQNYLLRDGSSCRIGEGI